jgi:hypothetical protein
MSTDSFDKFYLKLEVNAEHSESLDRLLIRYNQPNAQSPGQRLTEESMMRYFQERGHGIVEDAKPIMITGIKLRSPGRPSNSEGIPFTGSAARTDDQKLIDKMWHDHTAACKRAATLGVPPPPPPVPFFKDQACRVIRLNAAGAEQ